MSRVRRHDSQGSSRYCKTEIRESGSDSGDGPDVGEARMGVSESGGGDGRGSESGPEGPSAARHCAE
jgi:hypothetical protein